MANDGANEGFWRFQIRDKYGRWVEMGGAVTFTTDHPNFGRISGTGLFEGGSRPGFAMVRVKNHATLDDGVYEVSSDDIESVQAIIPADAPGLVQAKKLDAADGIAAKPSSSSKATSRKDLTGFTQLSGQKGSNPGGLYQDPATGEKFYVKIQDDARADNEVLASKLYKKLNINAVQVDKGSMDGKTVTYSPWVEDVDSDLLKKLSDDATYNSGRLATELKRGYAVDAWLANWDVVGTGFDNIVFDKDGNSLRVDPGGALLYRARGDRKGDKFTNTVDELKTLLGPDSTASKIYTGMNINIEVDSAKRLLEISNNEIDEIVDATVESPEDNALLKERLKGRREYILNKYGLLGYDSKDQYSGYDGVRALQGSDSLKVAELMGPGKEAGPRISTDLADTSGYLDRYDDPNTPLADVIEGDDIKQLLLRDGFKKLLTDGPNVKNGAHINEAFEAQHKIVYADLVAKDPKIAERFPEFDDYFKYTYQKLAIDDQFLIGTSPERDEDGGRKKTSWEGRYSAEDLALMKSINRSYAEKILKLNPDGRIKIYRNAYALAFSYGEEKTALPGYWSFDREFAYSFNGAQEGPKAYGNSFTGRYTASIAVDDVVGIIGMMRNANENVDKKYLDLTDEMPLSLSPEEVDGGVLKDVQYKGHVRDLTKPVGGRGDVMQTGSSGNTPFRSRADFTQHYLQPVPFDKKDLDKAASDAGVDVSSLNLEQLPDGRYQVKMGTVTQAVSLKKLQESLGMPLVVNNFTRSREGRDIENTEVWQNADNKITIISPEEIEKHTTISDVSFSDELLAELGPEAAEIDKIQQDIDDYLFYDKSNRKFDFKAPSESIDHRATKNAEMVDFFREKLQKIHADATKKIEDRKAESADRISRKVAGAQGVVDGTKVRLDDARNTLKLSPEDDMAKMNVKWLEDELVEKEKIVKELESGYDRTENPGHAPISERLEAALAILENGNYDLDGSLRALLLSGASREEFMKAYQESAEWKKNASPTPPPVQIGAGGLLPPPPFTFTYNPNELSDFTIENVFKKDIRLSDEDNKKAFAEAGEKLQNPPLEIAKEISAVQEVTSVSAGTYEDIQIGSLVEHGENSAMYGKISEKTTDASTGNVVLTIEWSDGTTSTSMADPSKPLKIWDNS